MNGPDNVETGKHLPYNAGGTSSVGLVPLVALTGTVLLLTAAGGGTFIWSTWLVTLAGAGASLLQHLRCDRSIHAPASVPLDKTWKLLEFAFLAAILFTLFAAVPWPQSMSNLMGRMRAVQQQTVSAMLKEGMRIGAIPEQRCWFSLSRNRAGTLRAALLLAAASSAFFLASLCSRPQREKYLSFLSWLGAAIALSGVIALRFQPQGDSLWWFYPMPHADPGPVAGFINPNHYAGFLAMLCPAALSIFVSNLSHRRFLCALVALVPFGMMSLGIFHSLSRGALIAWGVGLLTIPLFLLSRRAFFPACLVIVAAVLTVVLLFRFPPPAFRERITSLKFPQEDESAQVRMDAWRTCLKIWRSYPVIGAGANAFRVVYPQHRTTSRRSHMTHAESEYAQLLAEGGTVGTLIAAVLGGTLVHLLRLSQRSSHVPAFTPLGAAGALSAAAVHAVVEFALHLPLYTVTLATIVGTAIAREMPRGCSTRLKKVLLWTCLGTPIFLTPFLRPMRELDSPDHLRRAPIPVLTRALQWTPTSWFAWYELGRRVRHEYGKPAFEFGEACATQATAYDPNNYLLWLAVGKMRLRMEDYDGARKAFARARELRHWVAIPDVPKGGK
ncbi:MAG: O-antigen ligase family protein [Kiritimatiellia bacterium]